MKEALGPGSYPCCKSDRVVWVVGYPGLNLEGSRTGMLGGYPPPLSLLLSDETSSLFQILLGLKVPFTPLIFILSIKSSSSLVCHMGVQISTSVPSQPSRTAFQGEALWDRSLRDSLLSGQEGNLPPSPHRFVAL